MHVYPVGIAAGMIKEAAHVERGLCDLVQMIMFGSFTLEAREGNKEPVFYFDDQTQTSINAVGLRNKGLAHFLEVELPKIGAILQGTNCLIGVSLAPLRSGDTKAMMKLINACPYKHLIARIEINAACPNHREGEHLHPVLSHDAVAVAELLRELDDEDFYFNYALKIAPDTVQSTLEEIVKQCVRSAVAYIVSSNTRRGSSLIDGVQRLSVPQGGIAGAPLLQDGVAQIATLRSIIDGVGSPRSPKLIGCGGIMDAEALHAYLKAGADEIQVATLYYQYQVDGVQDLLTQYYAG